MSNFEIVTREDFSDVTYLLEVRHPMMARAAKPGQFVIVMLNETGERIPLTIADFDVKKGTITLVIQAVGKTTFQMMALPEKASVLDFIGPMGQPSHLERRDKVVLVGGGLGVAPVFPQLRLLKELGSNTISIIGFRTKEAMFWGDKFSRYSDELRIMTDDGSFGTKGFVTVELARILQQNSDIDEIIAIGPLPMMKACASPAGVGCCAYSSRMPHWLPSPNCCLNRGRSWGVEISRMSLRPASMSVESG